MKRTIFPILTILAAAMLQWSAPANALRSNARPQTSNIDFHITDRNFNVDFDLVLDSVNLKGNQQLLVTPVITGGNGESLDLPTVLINGRNMHYAWERKTYREDLRKRYDILTELRRVNGTPQTYQYSQRVPLQSWMYADDASLTLKYDTCGCGRNFGQALLPALPLNLNPTGKMTASYLSPAVTELPVQIHEGSARVQFEVDKTELHDSPYVCRNGQRIDNRQQLKVITDSIEYAIQDPNVEIARVEITGYASPESPYTHNDFLATNRSKALAEWIGDRYHLSRDVTRYGAVPENWAEFREQVLKAKDITEKQRADLLELIDRPAFGPDDYDRKEKELKTDPKFAALYKSKILPEWFPVLRTTKFRIATRLKPMPDEQLAKVIKTHPERLSLNQMFRVARLYPDGSPEFHDVITTALQYYPDNEEANTNAAVDAINKKDYAAAEKYVEKAGDNPQANNVRGILASNRQDFEAAAAYFRQALPLPEAQSNLDKLPVTQGKTLE